MSAPDYACLHDIIIKQPPWCKLRLLLVVVNIIAVIQINLSHFNQAQKQSRFLELDKLSFVEAEFKITVLGMFFGIPRVAVLVSVYASN